MWVIILKLRSQTMFQDRINKLEKKLVFPKQVIRPSILEDGMDHLSYFLSPSPGRTLHWVPRLLSLSFYPLLDADDRDVQHLYYFGFTVVSVGPDGDYAKRRYEYEELY
jgi:hypothetical protein